MTILEQLHRLQRLLDLIDTEYTDTPEQLADRLNLSPRQLFNLLDMIRAEGVEIEYSRRRQTYYYSGGKRLEIIFAIRDLTNDEIEKINGGSIFFVHCNFISASRPTFAPVIEQ